MRDYEELVDRLREILSFKKCAIAYDADFPVLKIIGDAADAIEELCRENESLANSVNEAAEILRNRSPKWISVEERLPEKYDQVLVYGRNGVQIDYYTGEKSVCGNPLFMVSEAKVTHWLYVPDPPKEDGNA